MNPFQWFSTIISVFLVKNVLLPAVWGSKIFRKGQNLASSKIRLSSKFQPNRTMYICAIAILVIPWSPYCSSRVSPRRGRPRSGCKRHVLHSRVGAGRLDQPELGSAVSPRSRGRARFQRSLQLQHQLQRSSRREYALCWDDGGRHWYLPGTNLKYI